MPPLVVMWGRRAPAPTRDPPNVGQDLGLEESGDQDGIELRAASLGERPHAIIEPVGAMVATTVGDGIEGVGDRDDTCLNRNVLGDEPMRIACSVPALVVSDHAITQIGVEERQGIQYVGAALRVGRNEASLLRGYFPFVIVHDVEERLVDFTDVVKERNALDAANGRLIEASGAREHHAVCRDAARVRASHSVVGIDGVEERFERRRGEAPGALRFAVLSNEESPNAGAEGEENGPSHGAERGKNGTSREAGHIVRRTATWSWETESAPSKKTGWGRSRECRRRPTLPRSLDRSTIGAAGLNDRVRDGNGCGPCAPAASDSIFLYYQTGK